MSERPKVEILPDGRVRYNCGTYRNEAERALGEKMAIFSLTNPTQPVSITDSGTVTGRLYALIEDGSGLLNARIRPRDGSNYVNCTAANRSVEKDLKEYFQDAVRVHGRGTWTRSEIGIWSCASLRISEVEPVKNISLREAINALRAIEVEWPDDPLAGMDAIEERDGAA